MAHPHPSPAAPPSPSQGRLQNAAGGIRAVEILPFFIFPQPYPQPQPQSDQEKIGFSDRPVGKTVHRKIVKKRGNSPKDPIGVGEREAIKSYPQSIHKLQRAFPQKERRVKISQSLAPYGLTDLSTLSTAPNIVTITILCIYVSLFLCPRATGESPNSRYHFHG